ARRVAAAAARPDGAVRPPARGLVRAGATVATPCARRGEGDVGRRRAPSAPTPSVRLDPVFHPSPRFTTPSSDPLREPPMITRHALSPPGRPPAVPPSRPASAAIALRRPAGPRRRRPSARGRLGVEWLEDRTLLATYTPMGFSDSYDPSAIAAKK